MAIEITMSNRPWAVDKRRFLEMSDRVEAKEQHLSSERAVYAPTMSDEPGGEHSSGNQSWLQHTAFRTSLSLSEVSGKFWTELKRILPADLLHVIDPYALDAGGVEPAVYAGNVVSLLKPALSVVERVVIIHGKPRDGVQQFLEENIAIVSPDTEVQFIRGTDMHARYLVADHSRALRMEFSFNRIGRTFGTVSSIEDLEDLAGVLDELKRLHPSEA